MVKKKVLLTVAFVTVTTVLGGVVTSYKMNQDSMVAKNTSQVATVGTMLLENAKMVESESNVAVKAKKMTFSCDVSGCTEKTDHTHGACGINDCTQIGEHSHDICSIVGCTETGAHIHNGEYCYPHSSDDGHAYHNCGVSGCTEVGNHTHNSCEVSGCTQTDEHNHDGNVGKHHHSGHH